MPLPLGLSSGSPSDFGYPGGPAADPRRFGPRQITAVYVALGLSWVWLTDLALLWLGVQDGRGFWVAAAEGTSFVLLSALLLRHLIRRGFRLNARANALLRAVTDRTTDAVYVKDLASRYLLFNEAAARSVGKSAAEVLGKDDTAIFDAESARRMQESDRAVIESGTPRTVEEVLTAAGATRTYLTMKAPYRDETGAVAGLVGISRDITDRKRAEEALRASEERYRALVESMTDGVFVNKGGRIAYANPALRRLLGADSPDQLLGKDVFEVIHPDYRPVVSEAIQQITATGQPILLAERKYVRLDGTPVDVESASAPFRDGGEVAIHVTVRDITERKRAEEALRASERRFRELADALPQIAWTAEPDGRIDHFNARATEYTGLPAEELCGWSWQSVVHPADLPRALEQWGEILRTGRGQEIAFRLRRADGEYRWHVGRQVPALDASGAVVKWYGTNTDVHDLKQTESALRESEAFNRAVLDSMTAHIAVVGTDGTIIAVNEAWTRFAAENACGHPPSETGVGANYLGVCRAGAAAGSKEARQAAEGIRRVLDRRVGRFILEYPCHCPAEHRWFLLTATPFREPLAGAVVAHVDITDRVQVESALRASEERSRSVIAALAEGIVLQDAGGEILDCNASAERILGLTADQIKGRSSLDSGWHVIREDGSPFPGEEHPSMVTLRTGRPCENVVMGVHKPDGSLVWITVNSEPVLRAGQPTPRGVVASFTDVTARKQAEEALVRQKRVLELIATGVPIGRILDEIVELVEEQLAGSLCSILLLDAGGRLRLGSARRLPAEYNAAIEGVAIGPSVGSCGTAAYRGEAVVVADIATDPLWADYRDFALGHGLRSCWSVPILAAQPAGEPGGAGRVLGTFALYRGEPAAPGARDLEVVAAAAHLAGIAIERDAAERAIRENEVRYRRLLDVLPTAVFTHADGRIVFCNPAFVRLMGASDPAEILGKSPFDVAAPEYHDLVRSRIDFVRETGQSAPGVEMRIVRADGHTAPVYSVSTPLTDRGRPSFLVALSDLTERERSQELLRSVMASVPDPIITTDEQGRILAVNPATERMFGYAAAELIGQNVKTLAPEPHRSRHDGYIARYLQTGQPRIMGGGREFLQRRKDGSLFPGELTLTEFRMDGRPHFSGVIRDVTERKKLEEQLRQSQKMEAVGRLAGGVAHDFNNLLTVINGYSDLTLSNLPPKDPNRAAVAAIRDAGERAARLTQQLLAFSRKAIVEPKVLDLNEVIGESVKLLRRLIGEDIVLTTILDPALSPIKIDPGQLEQVILNLVVNARDAMPTGGQLTVETRNVDLGEDALANYPDLRPGPHVRLSVTDTGCGMTDEVRAKVFEPFFTTKGVGKGTGLGLAVVHGAVKQAGGHVSVYSEVGVGTTFTLLFPAAPPAPLAPASGVTGLPIRGTETILLVEDEEAVRKIARIALHAQGYTILEADCGAEAIRVAESHPGPIHLLVTDVVMPEMGGRQVADALRIRRAGLRVLYMSGYTGEAVVRHGVMGADDAFIQKPFTPLGLARKVRSVLDGAA